MVSGGITKDDMSKSKVDPCGVSSLRVKANSVQCDKWIHGRCSRVKRVTQESLHAENVKGILQRQWSRNKHYVKWKLLWNSHILVTV